MQLKRLHSRLVISNSKAEIIQSQDEIQGRWPMIKNDDLKVKIYKNNKKIFF